MVEMDHENVQTITDKKNWKYSETMHEEFTSSYSIYKTTQTFIEMFVVCTLTYADKGAYLVTPY
jgi:hypothetical protein